MAIQLSSLTDLTDPRFARFLQRLTDDFLDNRSLQHAPWCYFELPHFRFDILHSSEMIMAVRVTSIQPHNEHLNFLYVDIDHRCSGFGELLLLDWMDRRQKDLLTIHVKTELVRTQNFYKKFGFETIVFESPGPSLQAWINQCTQFNPKTFQNAVLMANSSGAKPL